MNKAVQLGYFFLGIIPLIIYGGFNHANIPLRFSMILGLIALPYVLDFKNQQGNYRYAFLSLLLGLSLLLFRSNSLFYFSAVFALLYFLDNWWGRINTLPVLLVTVVSPVISIIVYIWSFPIRLQLSKLAAWTLQQVGMDIVSNGNLLVLEGNHFSVDPACIGLKMVVTSLVLGIIILAYFEKKKSKPFGFSQSSVLLTSILLGAIVANFIRLLTLVIFHILPENPLHDVVGLLSLMVYVLLPFYFLVRYISNKDVIKNVVDKTDLIPQQNLPFRKKLAYVILLLLLIFNGRTFLEAPIENSTKLEQIQHPGFNQQLTDRGMLKLQSKEALIYIKAPVRFFQGSHDPRFCWQGSGYKFSSVQIENIGGRECYTAILRKGKDQLFAAWWYQSGTVCTVKEWDWRWNNLKSGTDFYLVNISCESRSELESWVTINLEGI
ncbi:MAG: exosortase N [Saprospiraceae bacterium]